jgi:hypothetical protein
MADWWAEIVPATKPRPNEKLWKLWKNHHLYTCELKYHGEYGGGTGRLLGAAVSDRLWRE